jgi:hypothetical protein
LGAFDDSDCIGAITIQDVYTTISIVHDRIIQEAKRLFIYAMKEVKLLLTTLVLKIKHILVGSLKIEQVSVRKNSQEKCALNFMTCAFFRWWYTFTFALLLI